MRLEEYLRGTYLDEKRELDILQEQLREVLPVFLSTWDGGWPYQLSDRDPIGEIAQSQSTTAMIAFTIAVLSGKISESILIPSMPSWNESDELVAQCAKDLDRPFDSQFNMEFKKRLDTVLDQAVKHCVTSVVKANANRKGSAIASASTTFGQDDPLTLSWLSELLETTFCGDRYINSKARAFVKKAAGKVAKRVRGKGKQLDIPMNSEDDSLQHAFPYLRCLYLARKSNPNANEDHFWQYFENSIHLHLSYYLIPDSRFDPAELVFALEGAVLTGRERLDKGTIERVFAVLEECQEHNPYWRPTKPFLSTKRGTVLFPVSVEIANSLLRTFEHLDEGLLHDSYFARHVGLLRRYTQWILARVVTGHTKGRVKKPLDKFRGWHSEHVGGRDTIHLWETSQVALFLFHYRAMVRQHIARQALISSGFELRRPRDPDPTAWENFEKGEPFFGTSKGSMFSTYQTIGRKFIRARDDKSEIKPDYSMLLYGPPGTGKTLIATEIADALGYRLITITASDFLAAGAAAVEARAKAVFDALEEQRKTVILFDEMDHFLLNRESELYKDQDSMFQLMTPGMLTKINDLRAKKRSVFIIATNYAERIDPAIKRQGRIDQELLLLPPSWERREEILDARLREHAPGTLRAKLGLNQVAKQTKLLTWKELDVLAKDAVSKNQENPLEALKEFAKEVKPSITLASYENRFLVTGPKPFREFAAVAFLENEPSPGKLNRKNLKLQGLLEHLGGWQNAFNKLNSLGGKFDPEKLAAEAERETGVK